MGTARDFLAAVQQRADDPRAKYHHKPCSAPVCGSRHCQTARDRAALAAALTAVLDMDPIDVALGGLDAVVDVITDALTPKENDS
jgi:hypothetical protein